MMEVRTFETFRDLRNAAAALLRTHLLMPGAGPHAVMLAGGKTPLGIYRDIEARTAAADGTLRILLSDERHVPVEAAESNYGNLLGMLRALKLEEARVLRVHTEAALDDAAERYHAELASFLKGGGRITLGFLGLGADGHTASLFSGEDVRRGAGRYAIAVRRDPGPDRVSVTHELLTKAERLVFLAAGREKKDSVDALLRRPGSIAAGQAVAGAGRVEVWFSEQA
jgi:6-phosphogluconolactonase